MSHNTKLGYHRMVPQSRLFFAFGRVVLFTHKMKVCLRVARRLLGLCRNVDTGVASASLPRRHGQSTYARHHRPNRDIYRDAGGVSVRASVSDEYEYVYVYGEW